MSGTKRVDRFRVTESAGRTLAALAAMDGITGQQLLDEIVREGLRRVARAKGTRLMRVWKAGKA